MHPPISSSEKLEYRIQYEIFDHLDKKTEHMQWIRPPAFLALGASMTTHLIAKTASSVELTFRGIQLIHSSKPHSENRKRAWAMLTKAPLELMEWLVSPFALIWFGSFIICEPKYYILKSSEMSKAALRHAEAGTIDSEDYENDLYDANSIIKDRLMEWQKKNRGLRASQTSLNSKPDTSLASDSFFL